MHVPAGAHAAGSLRRRLGLTLLVLYGTGITVGAGIYVLIGAVAGHAGVHTPWAFVLAALVMGLTVASYAELTTRYPTSAGEAAYVRAGLRSRWLARATGLVTIVIGVVSSSAVALGAAGYIGQFVPLSRDLIALIVLLVLGAVAAWGILESVLLASLFTLVEVGGLLAIIAAAGLSHGVGVFALPPAPPPDAAALSGIAFASLLAFFAFIGFEDLANVVEEAKAPHRDIPWAMALTLLVSTLLYVAVAVVAVNAVPLADLAGSPAPLSLLFQRVAGTDPALISAIAVVATFNTVLAQLTMAARVVYGMARQGDLPARAGHVHPRTATPVLATALVVGWAGMLAVLVPLEPLAAGTSLATLGVFAMVNLALARIHRRKTPPPASGVRVPRWVPVLGFATCVAMIAASLVL
ncbi:MAG TPA: APC family permease [Xanthobacteraceae bacterium]|nr:APC family permease [Xanthobacteraceae bacterium]